MSSLGGERGFVEYEPLLWRVLGKLARDGYAVLPEDARDLIHDFYFEWSALNVRYQPDKGEFAPYLATSFYRFGRRRQLQLHRLRSRSVDIEECLNLVSLEMAPLVAVEKKQLATQLQSALGRLPHPQQQLFADYLSEHAPGERELAEKYQMTRYRVREMLAAAVSRVALQVMNDKRQTIEGDVAYRLWVADQSPRTVAAELGISIEQVNQAKSRFAQALLNSVHSMQVQRQEGRSIMPGIEVLRKALSAVNDDGALERLRVQAPQIRIALDEHDFVLTDAEAATLAAHPEWLARIYDALAEDERAANALDADQQQIESLLAREQEAMADAWSALLDKLDEIAAPAAPARWEQALLSASPPDAALLQYLRGQPSVRQGDPAAERLLQYGLTPAMLAAALHGLELLFNRVLRRTCDQAAAHPAQGDVSVKDGRHSATVSAALLTSQLAGTLDLADGMAAPLARSLSCMLEVSPLLINGYCQLASNTFVKLPDEARQRGFLTSDSLVRRWCATGREAISMQTVVSAGLH